MSYTPARPGRSSRGFTLVELLVVIGIIALLLSILLPSLQKARSSAIKVKCAAALREIGNCAQLYASDFKQYLNPLRVTMEGSANNPGYDISGFYYSSFGNVAGVRTTIDPYWHDFLSPYSSAAKHGVQSTSDSEAGNARESILWGCPAYEGYESTTLGGVNRIQTGYGWNPFPTYSATNPTNRTSGYPNGFNAYGPHASASDPDKESTWIAIGPSGKVRSGIWPKTVTFSNPSGRAFAADGQFWLLEALAPPQDGDIPPQKINTNVATYSSGVSGQTLFDWYRHGDYPEVEVPGDSGYFKNTDKGVSYNILYADGHVEGTNDRSDSYKSIRQTFP